MSCDFEVRAKRQPDDQKAIPFRVSCSQCLLPKPVNGGLISGQSKRRTPQKGRSSRKVVNKVRWPLEHLTISLGSVVSILDDDVGWVLRLLVEVVVDNFLGSSSITLLSIQGSTKKDD